MLEDIRIYLTQRLVVVRKNAMDLDDIITPSVRRQLEKLKKTKNWVVIPSGFQELKVKKGDESYGVNLIRKQCQKQCQCRFWEISGIPCVHVVVGYMHLNRDPDVEVSRWSGRRMTCSNCLDVGQPKTPKPNKTLCRKSQPESVSYTSSRCRGRGSRGKGGVKVSEVHMLEGVDLVEKDELSNALDHEYMEKLILEEEEKRLAREKEILKRQDDEALQQ
nr:hypothetical protein [Tanacetum cinerariifolium]